MRPRPGLRLRLTLVVALVFGLALAVLSIGMLRYVERDLRASTERSAVLMLTSYLDRNGVVPAADTVRRDQATQFFFLDPQGREITEGQYYDALISGKISQEGGDGEDVEQEAEEALADAAFEEFAPVPVGEPEPVELDDRVVAVAQTFRVEGVGDVQVGVSSPLQPVREGLDSLRRLLLVVVPALILVVAAITWFVASRALRPVEAITEQARAITASNLDQRLPVHDEHDEIGRLAVTMNRMLERIHDAQEQKKRLTADASHELRSPVAASISQLEVAMPSGDVDLWERTARTVLAEQQQLSTLVDDLLALSRMDERRALVRSDVDLDDLVISEAARPRSVPVHPVIEHPVRLVGDRALLVRAVRNLIDNAGRYARTRVRVTVRASGTHGVVVVEDDGPGIPPPERDRLLERFARGDDARDRTTGGAGLGLAIAHEVALAHGGDLRLGGSELGGAGVTLRLDRRQPPAS